MSDSTPRTNTASLRHVPQTAPVVAIHASHELYAPSRLLRAMRHAQNAGFAAASCSDHLAPWTMRRGHSGFAWAWLGAALAVTGLRFGVVVAPGPRYHPVVLAQATATLHEMFPGRFWVALGSGEALNESMCSSEWPEKATRNARLAEAAHIIRALWRGDTVEGANHYVVHHAHLATSAAIPPGLFGAALTEATAEWMGEWADGLLTVAGSARANVPAFRRGGGREKPVIVQAVVAYAPNERAALAVAHDQWRQAALSTDQLADLPTPHAFDAASRDVTPEDLRGRVHLAVCLDDVRTLIEETLETGVSEVYLHPLVTDLERFIGEVGEHVLPRVGRCPAAPGAPCDQIAPRSAAKP
jgi:coenzyme F420-dependent glucose-6-phosphate dehydrogenase